MLSPALPILFLATLSSASKISRRSDSPYHYTPIEFLYGADSRVTANITFGTSPNAQPITVVMDTGSADTWIWQPGATVNWGSQFLFILGPCNLTVPTQYNPALSPTSVTLNHSSEYAYAGNGKIVQGTIYANDTIFTSPSTNTSISNVQFALENFGMLRVLDNSSCTSITYDKGIIGLSPSTNTTQGPSFRQNLFHASKILSKTMVTWFNTHPGPLGTLTGGLLFGAIDTSKYSGPLVRVPSVVQTGQVGYYIPKPVISFNGREVVPDDNITCLMDSGTHGDYLPFSYNSSLVDEFFNSSAGLLVNENDVVGYNGSCESIPRELNITYLFEGMTEGESVRINVPLRNYARGAKIYGDTSGDICLLSLEVGGCTFGAPFYSAALVAVDDELDLIALAQGGVSQEGSGINMGSLKTFGKGETFEFV